MTTHTIDWTARPTALPPVEFHFGTPTSPAGGTVRADSVALTRDGRHWLATMGELHYARLDPSAWREALLRMRAGGIEVVSTYVFWIHHEEDRGTFDFTGSRDLRQFVEACHAVGMPLVVRLGPWCHGEVRNGGLPDWVVAACGKRARTLDPTFMGFTHALYEQIAAQLKDMLWKDGGPVVGVQVDNEFGGPAEYLLALKRMAVDLGIDVPIYTRTGWPSTSTPMPFGKLLPLFGAYADGFWARELTDLPGQYWRAFTFELVRTDAEVGADMLGKRHAADAADTPQYPYLTCEIGGGMEQSYHRRIRLDARDVLSVALCKLGSGGNLIGYYMYHGGTNPVGRHSTLMESQATAYWNDVPTRGYDFGAPLGQYGQVRPSYHELRRLHLFLADFGERLAAMPPAIPADRPRGRDDTGPLRWSVRSDGSAGFVFVNNYQRLTPMPGRPGVQLRVDLPGGPVTIPDQPIDLPADCYAVWPFGLEMGHVRLAYATAQLVCRLADGADTYFVFAQLPGIEPRFRFDGKPDRHDTVRPALSPFATFDDGAGHRVQVLLLSHEQSLQLWRFDVAGRPRLVLTAADLLLDEGTLHARGPAADAWVLPPVPGLPADGVFGRLSIRVDPAPAAPVTATPVRPAGPPRAIHTGSAHVAEAPTDADFAAAAAWRISGPAKPPGGLLRVQYVGDVARLSAGGQLLTDQFWNGLPFDLSLDTVTDDQWWAGLTLEVLPLQRNAPIYLPADAWSLLGGRPSAADLTGVEIVAAAERAVRL